MIVEAREIDVQDFQAAIFIFAGPDMLFPVVVESEKDQGLAVAFKEQKKALSQWATYAGPAGIGQYSLRTGQPIGVLSRLDAYFRVPTEKEIEEDFGDFGEQVMGPKILELSARERANTKNNGILRFWEEDYVYTGPSRLIKSVFWSRVSPGDLPADICGLVAEVNKPAEVGEMIIQQDYQIFHSEKGHLRYLQFRDPKQYHPAKLINFGKVEMDEGRLIYYPAKKGNPVDLSTTLREIY